jgi:hypothetical protein
LEYKSSNIDIANEWLASAFVKRMIPWWGI